MLATQKKTSLLMTLTLLTGLSVFTQILFSWAHSQTGYLIDSVVSASLASQILHSRIFLLGAAGFVLSQLVVYTVFVSAVWYLAISLGELFSLRWLYIYLLGIFLWVVSAVAILAANIYFVPRSFFSTLIQENVFHHPLTNTQLQFIFKFGTEILLITALLAFINLCRSLHHKNNLRRHGIVLIFLSGLLLLDLFTQISAQPKVVPGTADKPNIIIIGMDAVRPDYVGFYNKRKTLSPHIDAFLGSAISFSEAYTPLPRTFPSWSSILTSAHPLHNGARGNNTELSLIQVNETLPKRLRQAGYETIYGTDDTRFNNTNEIFGFDRVISPPMGVNDFTLGTANDFPLSNLLIPTFIGKFLFPYNYANHGATITYDPDNFLLLLREALHQRQNKPLFLAVHFTSSHWPFFWFNDRQTMGLRETSRYSFGVQAVDAQLAAFLHVLNENKLLDHSIVILLSDHGTSLGLPGDRPITKQHYQGNKENIKKITIAKYSTAPINSMDIDHDFGIDATYGYGGDILSLKQYHSLLAFKGYGVNIGTPHRVAGNISLMDIAPTVLDLLDETPMRASDGVSLKPYLFNAQLSPDRERPLFLETTFSIDEIEKENISVEKILAKTIKLFSIDPNSGLIYLKVDAEKVMNQDKQLGILQGDWLLAHIPKSQRSRWVKSQNTRHNPGGSQALTMTMQKYVVPPFMVLVNLKTGDWTTELNSAFARTAPLQSLREKLYAFYGDGDGLTQK